MAKDESIMTMSSRDSNSKKKKKSVTGSMFWKTILLVDSKYVSTDLEGSCDKTEVFLYINVI